MHIRNLVRFLLSGFTLGAVIPLSVFAQTFRNEVQSSITFKIQNLEIVANGKFETIDATIVFNKEKPENTQFSASVDVNSIKTGIRLRDKHLKGKMYFDMANHPKILLTLLKAKSLGNNQFEGIFKVKMKATEKLLTIPYAMKSINDEVAFEGQFKVNRRDFNIGTRSYTLADTANVNVRFVLKK